MRRVVLSDLHDACETWDCLVCGKPIAACRKEHDADETHHVPQILEDDTPIDCFGLKIAKVHDAYMHNMGLPYRLPEKPKARAKRGPRKLAFADGMKLAA